MVDIDDATENYRVKPDDRRLIEEFRRNPIGHHSPDLQRLLTRMRSAPVAGKYCLLVVKPNREWQLAQTIGKRKGPPRPLPERFTSMAAAEWFVFRKRWQALTGETLHD